MSEQNNTPNEGINFAFPARQATAENIIKVIGVGGGGGNAVNHMYNEGFHDVSYVMCNTDKKALAASPVPVHLQIGDGLGAGNVPERGRKAALESEDRIREMLNDGTQMVFITAGMGGGTGTGAAPVIAEIAKEMGILTVGIVTIPFRFEGVTKINQALVGVGEMAKKVDALLVINNQRLSDIYPDLSIREGFAKADSTLTVAAKSIVEIINMQGIINLDFRDVQMVLKDGGVAIMSTGYSEGEKRVTKAIEDALNSPLLNNRDIYRSNKILLKFTYSENNSQAALKMDEIGNEVDEFMKKFVKKVETKWGLDTDDSLGSKVKVTILASGFHMFNEDAEAEAGKAIHPEVPEEIVGAYYGNLEGDHTKKAHKVFLFADDDLDNEDIISAISSLPTYKRTSAELDRIKDKRRSVQ